jgi:sporulation protein YlmC with PRC-barrel domain
MLKKLSQMINFEILEMEGNHKSIGNVSDVYFDEEKWVLRYLVVDTGTWLSENLTLLSPYNVVEVDWNKEKILVDLSRKQIEDGPKAFLNKTPTRNYELRYNSYYGIPNYWGNSSYGIEIDGLWAGGLYPQKTENLETYNSNMDYESKEDQHLHSTNDILNFHIQAADEEVFGIISDFIIDDSTWGLRYILINTHKFWPGGKKILFAPEWVERFDWEHRFLVTNFHQKVIESFPEYDPEIPVEINLQKNLKDPLFQRDR